MPHLSKIFYFLLANLLGFLSAPVCYHLGVAWGRILPAEANEAQMRAFFVGIVMTWMVCALFSLASFFFEGKARLAFLLAPVVLPMAYGLRVLLLL